MTAVRSGEILPDLSNIMVWRVTYDGQNSNYQYVVLCVLMNKVSFHNRILDPGKRMLGGKVEVDLNQIVCIAIQGDAICRAA